MHIRSLYCSAIAFLLAAGICVSAGPGLADDTTGQAAPGAPASTTALSAPLAEGDVAVSGFSGARLAAPSVPAGVDPLTETVIDPNGLSLEIFDLSTLGGPTVGQVVAAPLKLALPANAIGQVFALAFDNGKGGGAPDLYAAATSAYGLQIVGPPGPGGVPTRLARGAQGAAFMAGQFGSIPGASPGSIYRIDGTTGAVTMFADTAFSGVPNTGAGIGGVAFDPQSGNLYASDLDTGIIHRFNTLAPGADLGQFDHGVAGRPAAGLPAVADDGRTANIGSPGFVAADPSTWGFTQPERRVGALAVKNGRLYYSVADGPSIWSVGLNADGSFGSDPRLELDIQAAQPFPVTGLAFDAAGDMIVAQRGTQGSPFDYGQFAAAGAQVLKYSPAPGGSAGGNWTLAPGEYPVGLPDGNRMGAGGVALAGGYNADGTRGTSCDATLLSTGDDLRDNPAIAAQLPPGPSSLAGVQINDATLLEPQNVPPVQSAFLAFDPNAAASASGHAGGVAAVSCLGGAASAAAPVVNPLASANPAVGGVANPAQNFAGGGTAAPLTPGGGGATAPVAPGGGTTAPANPAGGGGTTAATQPLTVSKAATATTCTEQGGCSFAITVHNPNQTAVPGPFAVEDVFTAGGAQLTQSSITDGPGAPWTCTSAAGGGPLTCTDPGPIPPGDTTFNLTFTPGQTGNATDVVNCAQPGGPNAPANLSPVPPATLPPPASSSVARTDITLDVEPEGGICSSTQGCSFNVTAGPGTGGADVRGPVKFKITASLGADPTPIKFALANDTLSPGITCQPEATGDALDCTSPDPEVASNLQLGFNIKPTLPTTGASAVVLHVAAQGAQSQADASGSIALSDGAPQGGTNPDARVTQQFQGPQCATIPLDKTKDRAPAPATVVNGLSIAKTLDKDAGPCTQGTTCSFDITVTNTTGAAVPGPISFSDFGTGEGTADLLPLTNATATGPFTCKPGEDGLGCVDNDALPGGQSLSEKVTVPVSALLVGPQTRNCALLGGGQVASCVAFPAPASPPSKDLAIAKTGPASCTIGAPCDFTVTVTNKGTADFPGPVVFTDLGTKEGATFDGGNIATVAAGQGLTCTPGNPSTCTFNGTIPTGQSKSFNLSYTVTAVDPVANLATPRNCAILEGDNADQSCVTVNVKGPPKPAPQNNPAPANNPAATPGSPAMLKITKTGPGETPTDPGACQANVVCPFTVTIQNTGGTPYLGSVILDDRLNGPVSFISPANPTSGWTCIEKNNVPFTPNGPPATGCTDMQVSLAPGATSTFVITDIAGPTWADQSLLSNCVSVNFASGNPPLDPASRLCGLVRISNPPPMLKVVKIAPNAATPDAQGSCGLGKADDPKELCDFSVQIINTGTTPYTGKIQFTDTVQQQPVGELGLETFDTANWKCTDQDNTDTGSCDAETITLAPGAQAIFAVDTTTGAGWKKDDILTNCVKMDFMGNATLDPASQLCASVKLDPFNVQVQKSGDQSCAAGEDCHFTLSLFDPGPIDHDAPVTISDKLNVGSAPITSIDPPLPCATQPTEVPFTCTTPGNFPLKVGAPPFVYHLTVRLPAGQASYTNCAVVGPDADGDANIELGAVKSCVITQMQPKPASHLVIKKTGPTTCTPGQACAFSISITNSGNAMFDGPLTITDHLDIGTGPIVGGFALCDTAPISVPYKCMERRLQLAPGTSTSSAVVVQLPNTAATSATNCAILDDTGGMAVLPDNKSCATVPLNQGNGGSNGTLPQTPSASPPARTPAPPGAGTGGSNGINLQPDQTPGSATPPAAAQPPACFSNMVPNGSGGCACPPDTGWDGKQCSVGTGGSNGIESTPIAIPPTTSPAQTTAVQPATPPAGTGGSNGIGPQPETACPGGTTGIYPACRAIRPGNPRPAPVLKCPANTTGVYPNCRPVVRPQQVRQCPAGMVGAPPACACPAGTHLARSGRSCVNNPVQRPTPAQLCRNGMVGTFPDCACPGGTHLSRRGCVANPANSPFGGINSSMGGLDFPMGGFNFPRGSGRFPSGGRYPGEGRPSPAPTGNGGSNGTQQQTTPRPHFCPGGGHYSPTLHRCLAAAGTTTPPPAPAPAPATPDNPVDFGACARCGDTGPVVK